MAMASVMSAAEAVEQFIKNGDTLAAGGFANGLMHPEEILIAIEQSFISKGAPEI